MAMAYIWVAMVAASVLFGSINGRLGELGNAAMNGASEAVTLCISIGGMICLWSGIMEVMRASGLTDILAKFLSPVLKRLFPVASKDKDTMSALSSNVGANLLGLGNAATPMGIRAADGITRLTGRESASDELCRLVVLNTASVQLLPTTIAAVRAANGAASAFDILPAVWISSGISVIVGLTAAKLLSKVL